MLTDAADALGVRIAASANNASPSVQKFVVSRVLANNEIPVKVGPRRPGDPAVLIASSERIKEELDWRPAFQDLRVIIESAWDWMQTHPNGYE